MDKDFSIELKNLISESRLIAIDLGYKHISSIHFFLADCNINDKYSIKPFAFQTESEYKTFLKNEKVDESTILAENLPLTVEAEKVILKAIKLRRYYSDTYVRPYHLFLSASQLPESLFSKIFTPQENLHKKLEKYYMQIGQLNSMNIKRTLLQKISAKFLTSSM